MLITLEQMRKLHAIQLVMFIELKRVMEELGIRYYFVHGSLLSAVTTHEFIEEDDDIDIAIFRQDYERLMTEGNELLAAPYFLQWSVNDDFPLGFAKLRNKETEFYQRVLEKCACNKGIYIDIFPIDYVPVSESFFKMGRRILLETRISSRLNAKFGWKKKCMIVLSKIAYPSYRLAMVKREALYSSCKQSEYVTIFGGKRSERKMPQRWFDSVVFAEFCGIKVSCPQAFDAYLSRIYGVNYREKNPAEDRITKNREIEVSASYIDFGNGEIIGKK